jgi:hypothetical protein
VRLVEPTTSFGRRVEATLHGGAEFMMLLAKIIITGCLMILFGVLAYIVITSRKAFKKFSRLDTAARNRLVLIDYYMAAVRRFSNEELLKLSKLSEDAINAINLLDDHEKKLRAMRESIG